MKNIITLYSKDEAWSGIFNAEFIDQKLTPGYFGDLEEYSIYKPAGLYWRHLEPYRYCDFLDGWFAIDNAKYIDEALAELDLRFEQRCRGGGDSLFGKIHWNINNPPKVLPTNPIPSNLWDVPNEISQLSENYFYLDGQEGDFISNGTTQLYTGSNSTITLTNKQSIDFFPNVLHIEVHGDGDWSGDFIPMSSIKNLKTGYYPLITQHPFHNPLYGGLTWSANHRGCAYGIEGWMIIDQIAFDGDELTSIDLRFEQHCDGKTPALNGKIHWNSP